MFVRVGTLYQLMLFWYANPSFMANDKYIFTPKLVLFDLDGTLLDTMQIYADVAAELIATNYAMDRGRARALYLATSGLPFVRQIDMIVGLNPKNKQTVEMFERQKLEATQMVRITPGDKNTLKNLSKKGYVLGITSNNMQENVNEFVQQENLQSIFCRWLGWNDPGRINKWLGREKPSSKGEVHVSDFERVLKMPRSEMLFIGDSLKDAELSASSRVAFLPKLGTFTKEDFMDKFPGAHKNFISSISELHNLLP